MPTSPVTKPARYLAEYDHGVDDKRRVQVPAKWRPPEGEQDGFEIMLCQWQLPGQPPCLLALPPAACQEMDARIRALPFGDPEAEKLRRILSGISDVVTLDSAGRICLPQKLAEAAQIKTKAMLVGMWDRFQLWSPENYALVKSADAADAAKVIKLI